MQRPGASGSIYAIADYFELNPALIEPSDPRSGEDQLRSVLGVARERGIRPMADLVIDHCAADSELVMGHPEWIAFDSDGALIHPLGASRTARLRCGPISLNLTIRVRRP